MTYEFMISRPELVKADRYVRKSAWKKLLRGRKKLLVTFGGVLLWIPIGYVWAHHRATCGLTASIWLAVSVVLVVIAIGCRHLLLQYFYRDMLLKDGPRLGKMQLNFEDDEFSVKCGRVSTEASFEDIREMEEDDQF